MKLKQYFQSWKADHWIALSAVVIAICSLALSIWQGMVIRQHYKISVRPIVIISGAHNEKGSGFLLGNSGLGPALVKWFEVTVDGKPVRNWKEFSSELGMPDKFPYYYWVPAPATVIQPQEPKNLFWVLPGKANQILRKTNKRITIRMCYCSIYNECWLAGGGPNSPPFQACGDQPITRFEPHRLD